ncbi:cholesterol 24-hydroxylase [Exaiptasia diaphana]|uniref:Cytochrome P450 n=1 Tax=Exaiptasia diaphana TaxID=2652724 RepID=A0A913WPB2_EXADI|nr:cholesterol 24-hydroxylase [Exaiptasia diaphana]KXJ19039.1 Cholesterol 24-hydroxylase [Exaiptasia diaphana]
MALLLSVDVLLKVLCLLTFLVIILFVCAVIYIYHKHSQYRHIPGPKRDSFFLGNVPTLNEEINVRQRCIQDVWFDWHLEFGAVFVFWVYFTPVAMFLDPEDVKKVLITLNLPKAGRVYNRLAYVYGQRMAGNGILTELNHEIWKKKRKRLDKAFHRSYLMNLMESFNKICDIFLDKIGKMADGKTEVEMSGEFGRVTLDVIGKVGFGIDTKAVESATSPFPVAVTGVLEGVESSFRNPFWMFKFWNWPYQNEVIKTVQYLRQFAFSVIDKRIAEGNGDRKDILAHLVSLKESSENEDYQMENMVDDFGTFFLAGQETTSNQLAFTLFEVLEHPDIKNRIVEEIQDVLGEKQFVAYDDLGKLEYLGMTLKESLRMHPPIGGTQRILYHQEMIGGYNVPANTPVNVSYHITQNSPHYWKDPEVFDPTRFELKNKIGRSSTQYTPFSSGPRTCIGKTLAEFEARVIMARLFQEFELELVPGQKLAITQKTTIRPKNGVKCFIRRRK